MGCGPKIKKRRKTGQRGSTRETPRIQDDSGAMIVLPRLPNKCPNCGASLNEKSVKWIGPTTAKCPYCDTGIPLEFDRIT
ncbi:MAG: hypothetical protein ACTSYL_10890 [Candidatus Thorarchaeota archaeon]